LNLECGIRLIVVTGLAPVRQYRLTVIALWKRLIVRKTSLGNRKGCPYDAKGSLCKNNYALRIVRFLFSVFHKKSRPKAA